jgi:hypothetical protein
LGRAEGEPLHALALRWTRTERLIPQDATIGFVFASEAEGHEFYKKVANRSKYASEYESDLTGRGAGALCSLI